MLPKGGKGRDSALARCVSARGDAEGCQTKNTPFRVQQVTITKALTKKATMAETSFGEW